MYLGIDISELKDKKAYHTAKEISQQPDVWVESIKNMSKKSNEIKQFKENFLKEDNLRIILTGAGTSAFAGEICAPYLSEFLQMPVEAIATTDIVGTPAKYLYKNRPTVLISFARSGNSPESVAAVDLVNKYVDNVYQIVITCNKDGHLAKNSINDDKNLVILMPDACNDEGFAMTSSVTTMILNCIGIFKIEHIDAYLKDVIKLSTSVDNFIEKNINHILDLAKEYVERIIYLGLGSLKGMSRESALKLLELTSGIVNANYDTPLGFRHGPKSVVNDKTITIFYLSNNPYSRLYDVDLINEMSKQRKKDKILLVGCNIDNDLKELVNDFVEIEDLCFSEDNEVFLALQQLIFGQIFSFYKSLVLGITPDNPCPTGEVNKVVKGVIIHECCM
ncbi:MULTISPECIES: SIS domain-containing protein [unclassified Romboutsia]|uniref:SIS domain-containing protein n=1 Tax=unclassified Romboutsia TaxID=2626894 RepID=UPI000F051368|nr:MULTISPECIES: SIS domain-containing protein [unclassified Romboutsia]